MCGITGVLAVRQPSLEDVRRMTDAVKHRGPDDDDVWQDADAGISLGHRRLAILDLTAAGHQPMQSHSGRWVIVLNGEIYNHLDLRRELESGDGVIEWRGHSDTETLLESISRWGVRATIERAVGMFAIALWDREDRRLYLLRDRFGEKPLYYGWSRGAFLFGSELHALRAYPGFDNEVDRDVVSLYMQFGYVPAPYSIYRNVFKLEPGCLLSISLADASSSPSEAPFAPVTAGRFSIERYWSAVEVAERGLGNPIDDDREAADELESRLSTAVRIQSIADVPLGAFLSGGIDSSTIAALMQAQSSRAVRTFTIGFAEAGFNEAHYAKEIAQHLGTDHTELYVSPKDAQEVIPMLPALYSEPFADASQIPTYLVARMTRAHVTVALSGDAGDELFGGYTRYTWGRRIWSRVGWMNPRARRALGSAVQRVPAKSWDVIGARLPIASRISRLGDKAHKLAYRLRTVDSADDLYRGLVTEWESGSVALGSRKRLRTLLDDKSKLHSIHDPENRMMLLDALTYLPDDILQKVDRAAMGVSLETRVPFLDHRVAELAWRIPLSMKIRGGQGKWILRNVLERHIPRSLFERPKAGFGIPLSDWLRGPLRDWASDLLSDESIQEIGLLDSAPIRETWREHLSGSRDWTARLWFALMLQAWAKRGVV